MAIEFGPRRFLTLSSGQGLPQNSVYAMAQDASGYVWLGTGDGLARYDGHDLLVFKNNPDDPESISDNYIRALAFDRDGALWIGTDGGGLNRFDPATAKSQRIRHTDAVSTSLPSDQVYSLAIGESGELWVGTGRGLAVRRPAQPGFEAVSLPGAAETEPVRSLHRAPSGRLWIGTETAGVYAIDSRSAASRLPVETGGVNDLLETDPNTLWLATRSMGLIRVDAPYDNPTVTVAWSAAAGQEPSNLPLNALRADDLGRLWIATDGKGLHSFDPASSRTAHYRNSPGDPGSLTNDTVISLLRDGDGTIWVGTLWFGVSRFAAQPPILHFLSDPLSSPGLPDMAVLAFAEDAATDQVWVGTAAGLALLDSHAGRFLVPPAFHGTAGKALAGGVWALAIQGPTLWIGTSMGLIAWNRDTGDTRIHRHDSSDPATLSNDRVRILRIGRGGELWVGTTKGLNRLDPATGEIQRFLHDPQDPGSLPNDQIRGLREVGDGVLWVGTAGGLSRRDADGRFRTWKADLDKRTSLADDNVRDIHQTADGILWIATGNGLTRFDPATGAMTILDGRDGFPNTTLYGILPDDAGHLWISSNSGLVRLDPKDTRRPVVFTPEHGLQDNEFNFGAFLRLSDGRMLFGGVRGFNLFHPDALSRPPAQGIHLTMKEVTVIRNGVGRQHPATAAASVTVDGNGESLEIEFLGIDYLAPQSVRYSHRLEGRDREWGAWEKDTRKIHYGSLPPGSYLFRVRAENGRGTPARTEIALPVLVVPALWQEWWFIPACAALGTIMAGGSLHIIHRTRLTASLRRERELGNRVNERTAELRWSNIELRRVLEERGRLYRHLSHQLRSPLTVISSVLQRRRGEQQDDLAPLALGNAKRLEKLIDDLLSLARPDDRSDRPEPSVLDVSTVANWLAPSHQIMAAAQDLSFEVRIEEGATVRMPIGAVQCILDALVENAIKYTNPGGKVMLSVFTDGTHVTLEVSDTGIGILESEREIIFEEFKRGTQSAVSKRPGVGLGLPMAKAETEHYGGRISVASQIGAGTTFTVVFPKIEAMTEAQTGAGLASGPESMVPQTPALFSEQRRPFTFGATKPRLLIIEDERDLAKLIGDLFTEECDCTLVHTVQDGLLEAKTQPHAILCDLMLPDGSGFDLVKSLKTNPLLAHVPLLLLTALRNEENVLLGLSYKADDYIVKPFSNEELRLRVFTQIQNRQASLTYFKRSNPNGEATEEHGGLLHSLIAREQLTKAEKAFLTGLQAAILPDPSPQNKRHAKASTVLHDVATRMNRSENQIKYDLQCLSSKTGFSWVSFKNIATVVTMEYALKKMEDGDKIKTIAATINLTPSSLSVKFKKIFSVSPIEWKSQSKENVAMVQWGRYFAEMGEGDS